MNFKNKKIKLVHISSIKKGDTVICLDGYCRTVGSVNLDRGFCGVTLFGDSYNTGTKPVKKVIL